MNRTPDHLLSAAASDPALAQLCDEIIERLQAGDRVDMASLALEHPEYADQLRRLLPALEALVDLGASSAQHPSRVVSKQGTSDLAPKVLGDYRILREIGRGGMGVVYEAEQRSLNRRVALKVLPMAAALDARQFQRFQLEAQAAACLHHNNIVPVFAVGTEGGVPFYAMQYIEGRSLAEVIHELRRAEGLESEAARTGGRGGGLGWPTSRRPRWPAASFPARPRHRKPTPQTRTPTERGPIACPLPPGEGAEGGEGLLPAVRKPSKTASSTRTRDYCRNIAGLGLQAAEALDHAHTRGILHRDIKPAQPPARRRGPSLGHRLRPGPDPGQPRPDPLRRHPGHVAVHEPRAGAGQARRHRRPHGCLFARSDSLRAADPATRLRRQGPRRDPPQDRRATSRRRCGSSTPRFPRTWKRSSTRRWPRSRPSGTRRRRNWPTTCGITWRPGRSGRDGRACWTARPSGGDGTQRAWRPRA